MEVYLDTNVKVKAYKKTDIQIEDGTMSYIDINNYIDIIVQRPKIIVFILGIELIFLILKYMIEVIKKIYIQLQNFRKQNYIFQIFNIFKNKDLIKNSLVLMVNIIFIILVIKTISFKFCLPNNFTISTINFEFIKNTYLSFIQANIVIQNFKSFEALNSISNFVFALALFCKVFILSEVKNFRF